MSSENCLEICLNCGKKLKNNESDFCKNCEDMLSEENFSYFPGENKLKKYIHNAKSKINLKKYSLTIFAFLSLMVYSISNFYFYMNYGFFLGPIDNILLINTVIISIGIVGSIYLNINRLLGSIILIGTGFILFLMGSEIYLFSNDILVYLQYIGSMMVFATGAIGITS